MILSCFIERRGGLYIGIIEQESYKRGQPGPLALKLITWRRGNQHWNQVKLIPETSKPEEQQTLWRTSKTLGELKQIKRMRRKIGDDRLRTKDQNPDRTTVQLKQRRRTKTLRSHVLFCLGLFSFCFLFISSFLLKDKSGMSRVIQRKEEK